MKRSPPKVRDSAVGLPPLSQMQREKSDNVDPIVAGQSSSLSEPDEYHTSDNRSHGEKPANFTLRSKNVRKRGSNKKTTENVVGSSLNNYGELPEILKNLQAEMTEQRKENAELRKEIEQMKQLKQHFHPPQIPQESVFVRASTPALNNTVPETRHRTNPNHETVITPRSTSIPKGLRALLDSGISPTYDAWEHLMRANLRTYRHCFDDEQSIIDHIFAQTSGKAMEHLTERMKFEHPESFTHQEEIFDWLKGFFKDPNERETARVQYQKCRMSQNENFNTFYSRFSSLASRARIEQSDQLQDMYRKLYPDLHQQAMNFMATNPDFGSAIKRFHFLDNELRLNQESRNRRDRIRIGNQKFTQQLPYSKPLSKVKFEEKDPVRQFNPHRKLAHDSTPMFSEQDRKCYNCQKFGHLSKDCAKPKVENSHKHQINHISDEISNGEEQNEDPKQTNEDESDEDLYDVSENDEP